MVDLLQLAPSELLAFASNNSRSGTVAPMKVSDGSAEFSPDSLAQMILRWDAATGAESDSTAAPAYLSAMQKLVKRIAQLRSTHEGAIDSLQALLPQVALEAEAVAVAANQDRFTIDSQPTAISQTEGGSRTTHSLKTLAPHLLWCLMQITHESMELIEGKFAQISQADQPWQSGMVRLVMLLELKTEQTKQIMDLVTFQTEVAVLNGNCQLQLESLLSSQPLSVTAFLQRLLTQPVAHPALKPFFAGIPAEWLIPGHNWQTGWASIRLALAFEPVAPQAQNLASVVAASNTAASNTAASDTAASDTAELTTALPTLRFTQPAWLEQHITLAVEHQLLQLLRQDLLQQDLHCTATTAPIDAESTLKQGCAAIEALQNSLTLASRTFAQQDISLDALALRLIWGINRTAYEVMQLTSGIQVQLLQPQQAWMSGMLRLGLYLTVSLPHQTWRYDLAQRTLAEPTSLLDQRTIVQSPHHLWCLQPTSLSQLETELWQQIQTHAPELLLLQSATEIYAGTGTYAENKTVWQMGVVQLQASFEFAAMLTQSLSQTKFVI